MFQLCDCYTYGSDLDQIIAKSVEISGDNSRLVEDAIRHAVSRYNDLRDFSIKQSISETCRGCDILIRAERAYRRVHRPFYRTWKAGVEACAFVNNFLPYAGAFFVYRALNYQPPLFLTFVMPYLVIVGLQSYFVSIFFGWDFGVAYGFFAVASGVFALRMKYSDDKANIDIEGWKERLRTDDIKKVIQFYLSETRGNTP